jgi:hypothetical protein
MMQTATKRAKSLTSAFVVSFVAIGELSEPRPSDGTVDDLLEENKYVCRT